MCTQNVCVCPDWCLMPTWIFWSNSLGYVCQFLRLNNTISSPTGMTKVTIAGLKPETTYEVKMSAINGKGEGESSLARTFKTEPVRKYCPRCSCPCSQKTLHPNALNVHCLLMSSWAQMFSTLYTPLFLRQAPVQSFSIQATRMQLPLPNPTWLNSDNYVKINLSMLHHWTVMCFFPHACLQCVRQSFLPSFHSTALCHINP